VSEVTLSPEQVRDREALIALYGEPVFNMAVELSGLAPCCGWVGPGKPPPWAQPKHRRDTRRRL